MAKNKCADELIIELVTRYGCSVTIRPAPPYVHDDSMVTFELRRGERRVTEVIDYGRLEMQKDREHGECSVIERCAERLLMRPLRDIIRQHFYGEDSSDEKR